MEEMLFKTYPSLEDEPFDLFKRRHLQLKKFPHSSRNTQPANSNLLESPVDRSGENCKADSPGPGLLSQKPSKALNLTHGCPPQDGQPLALKALLTLPTVQCRELELQTGSSIKTPELRNTKGSEEPKGSKQSDKRIPQQKTKRKWLRNDFTKESSKCETKRHQKSLKKRQPSLSRPLHEAHSRLLEPLAQHPAQQVKHIKRDRFSAFDEHNFPTLAPHQPDQGQKTRRIIPISGLLLSSQDYYQLSRLPLIALDREERYNWGHVKARVKPRGLVSRKKRAVLNLSSQAPDPMVDLLKRTERIRNKFNLLAHVSPRSNHRARLKKINRVYSPKCGHFPPPSRCRKRRELALERTGVSLVSRTHFEPSARKSGHEFREPTEVLALPISNLDGQDLQNASCTEHPRYKYNRITKKTQISGSSEPAVADECSNTPPPLANAVMADEVSKLPEMLGEHAVRGSESPIECHVLPTDFDPSTSEKKNEPPDSSITNGTLPLLCSASIGPKECLVQGSTKAIGDQFISKADHSGRESLSTNPTGRKRSVFGTLLDELGDGNWARRVTFKDTMQVRYLSADRVDGAQASREPTVGQFETTLAGEPILSLDTDGVDISPLNESQDVQISLHASNDAGRGSLTAGPYAQYSANAYSRVSVCSRPESESKSSNTPALDLNDQDSKGLSGPSHKLNSCPQDASGDVASNGVHLNNILAPPTPSPVKLAKSSGGSDSQWSSSGMDSNADEREIAEPWGHDRYHSQLCQDNQENEEDYPMHSTVSSDDIPLGDRYTSSSTAPSHHSQSYQRFEHYVGMLSHKRRPMEIWLPSLERESEGTPPAAQLASDATGTFGNSESQSSCSQSHIAPAPSQVRQRSHRGRQHTNAITQILVSCETHRQRRRKLDQMPSFFATRS